MTYEKICNFCNISFSSGRKKSRFCSKDCMYEWRKSTNWEEVVCIGCNTQFLRRKNDIRRRTGLPQQYCSGNCSRASESKKQKLSTWGKSDKNHFYREEVQAKARDTKRRKYDDPYFNGNPDVYPGFTKLLNVIQMRCKFTNGAQYICEVTIHDLVSAWSSQDGKCNYTGVSLVLPRGRGQKDPLRTASLDRIDSTKGYVKGNIQFISIMANHAKNKFSHETMIEFCKLIRDNE